MMSSPYCRDALRLRQYSCGTRRWAAVPRGPLRPRARARPMPSRAGRTSPPLLTDRSSDRFLPGAFAEPSLITGAGGRSGQWGRRPASFVPHGPPSAGAASTPSRRSSPRASGATSVRNRDSRRTGRRGWSGRRCDDGVRMYPGRPRRRPGRRAPEAAVIARLIPFPPTRDRPPWQRWDPSIGP